MDIHFDVVFLFRFLSDLVYVNLMELIWQRITNGENWWLIAFAVLCYGLYKVIMFLSDRFFDEKHGVVPRVVNAHLEFLAESKKNDLLMSNILEKTSRESRAELNDIASLLGNLERKIELSRRVNPNDRELFNILFNESPIPIAFIGAEGNFLEINDALSEFIGYSNAEIISLNVSDVTHGDDIGNDIASKEAIFTGERTSYRMEHTYIRKNGNECRATLHAFRYPETGIFQHFVSIIIPEVGWRSTF